MPLKSFVFPAENIWWWKRKTKRGRLQPCTVFPDPCQYQQMHRIKQIEKVFQGQPPFSIVEIDRQESEGRCHFPAKRDAPCDALVFSVIAEEI